MLRSHTGRADWTAECLMEGTHSWWGLLPSASTSTGHGGWLSAGSVAQQTFPHTGRPEKVVCWLPFIHWRPEDASGCGAQLIRVAVVRGFVSLAQTPQLCFSSLSNAQCALWLCAFPELRTLCSSWTSSLSELFPLWASVCVGRHVCEVGGRRPAANGTYCCIAGARLSGSLPAIWLKGFVWHFRGSQSYPSCLTLGLWSMSVSIWWVAQRQPREPLLNLPPPVDFSGQKMTVHCHFCHYTCPTYSWQGDFASDTRDSKVHFWSGAWGDAVTSSGGQVIYFHCFPRTTLKIHLCEIELRVEGCKLESGVVETAHTW